MTDDPDAPEDQRELLGHTLTMLRRKAGKSLSQLAEDTGYERSYLNRLENAVRLSKRTPMEDLDAYYDTGGLLVKLWRGARDSVVVDRYRLFMRYEAEATIMHKFMLSIPGLLQTEDYARVVLSSSPGQWSPEELEEQVAARLGRREVLARTPPPHIRIVLDEGALRRPVADGGVWTAQLNHLLLTATNHPSTVVQVLPFTAGVHDLMGGSLSLLWQEDGTAVAYLEGSKSGELVEDPREVAAYRLSYDHIRDRALTPAATTAFLIALLEEYSA